VTTSSTDVDHSYLLGSSNEEVERLLAQTLVYEREARWLFDDVEPIPGGRALDLGCGVLGVLPFLADLVGSERTAGTVVGVDADPTMLQHARQECTVRGIDGVDLIEADAADTGLPAESFDVVHIRLLLVNVANPAEILREAVRLLRPGGLLLIQEFDLHNWRCEPPNPVFTELYRLLVAVWQHRGFDPFIGRRAPGLLAGFGLCGIGAHGHSGIDGHADPYRRLLVDVARRVAPHLVTLGMCEPDRLDALITAADSLLADPANVVIRPLLVQTWATRPSA
jgi:ubiquinone/menaquinone biosynthesis C-methylase UbiE